MNNYKERASVVIDALAKVNKATFRQYKWTYEDEHGGTMVAVDVAKNGHYSITLSEPKTFLGIVYGHTITKIATDEPGCDWGTAAVIKDSLALLNNQLFTAP